MHSRSPHTATLIGGCLALAGFVMIGLGWRGGAATLFVPTQVAYGVSGGMVGLGLIGTGLTVLAVQTTRIHTARRSRALQQLVGDTVEIFAAVRTRTADGTRPLPVPLPRPARVPQGPQPWAPPADAAPGSNGHAPAPAMDDAIWKPDVMLVPGGKTFHTPTCRIVASSGKALNLTAKEALTAGLRPCRVCGASSA
jgi:hypothetical protein